MSEMTLKEAQDILFEHIEEGTKCICCGRFVKIYKRKLNSGMARSLITMYKAGGKDWQHIPTTTDRASREEGKLAHWGLIEEETERRADGGRAGYWKVTEDGEKFVKGLRSVFEYAMIFDGELLELTGKKVYIQSCLGKAFNYRELMKV